MKYQKFRLLLLSFICFVLYGCATPASVQNSGDYEICRLSLLRPPLQSVQAINEADRQIRVRRLNCNIYASTIFQQQQLGLQQLQQGVNMMNNSRNTTPNFNTQNTGVSCFKSREWTSGSLRNCVYSCMGSEAVQTFSITQICPLTMNR